MVKKILGLIALVAVLSGCDATVQVVCMNSGAPVGRAVVAADSTLGKGTVAEGATGLNGKIEMVLPYGDYKLKASKDGYVPAEGFIHVDLFSALFGAKADIPLIKKPTTTAAVTANIVQ